MLRAADLFCGGGGFTTGAEASGRVKVELAINHWRTAIYTHQTNHPNTRHICARIDDIDPRNDKTIPDLDLLLASPECTHHSIARGGMPIDDQKRATPWHVLVWAEAKRPAWIVVENVREFRDWGPLNSNCRPIKSRKGEIFRQWIKSLEAIGYQVDHQLLNAADFGAATKRIRLFIIARRKRSRLDIPWPEPTHAGNWKPAYSIIDWTKPCPSIFTRKRPLAEKTLRRIEIGLRKFVGEAAEPFVVTLRFDRGGLDKTVSGIGGPIGTITAGGTHHGLAVPFLLDVNHGGHDHRTASMDRPIGTITAGGNGKALCVPFLTKYYGNGGAAPIDEPLNTITTKNHFGLAMVSLVQTMNELGVYDIGFRMLDVDELARAQGFPEGYYLHGNKGERVKQVGNAVCPPVAKALCETIAEAA